MEQIVQQVDQTEQISGGTSPMNVSARTLRGLRSIAVAISLLFVLLFVWTARSRAVFPFDVFDTGMLLSVQQVAGGQPLYVQPDLHFIPFLYTPIYYYAAAAMSHLTGVNYAALRDVSTLATLGCFALLYLLVFRETRRHYAAIVTIGCFASCYPVTLQWFDIGRVDMLYLFFFLCACYATRWMHPAIAAVLWVCAFQTKQGVLPVAILLLAHEWKRPRRTVLGMVTFAVTLACSIAWLNHVTSGWYGFYVFDLVNGLGYDLHAAARYLTSDLMGVYGIALLLILAAFAVTPPRWRSATTSFYGLGCLGTVVFCGYIRAHRGAAPNAVLPAYLWISILTGIALVRLERAVSSTSSVKGRLTTAVALTAVTIQLGMHLYSPHEYRPSPSQYIQRFAFEDQLRAMTGDVLVLSHPEDAVFAGKTQYAHGDAAGSIIDAKDHTAGDRLMAQYADMIHQRRFAAVVLDRRPELILSSTRSWMPKDFITFYPIKVIAHGWDNTDFGSQPALIYLPCSEVETARKLEPHVDTNACTSSPE